MAGLQDHISCTFQFRLRQVLVQGVCGPGRAVHWDGVGRHGQGEGEPCRHGHGLRDAEQVPQQRSARAEPAAAAGCRKGAETLHVSIIHGRNRAHCQINHCKRNH